MRLFKKFTCAKVWNLCDQIFVRAALRVSLDYFIGRRPL